MQLRKLIFTVAFFMVAIAVVEAQTSMATVSNDNFIFNEDEDLPELEGENWTFYHDKDHKVYYIDFETINV
ncbi:MAG: hypothetical protein D6816_08560, partial [Bacteroidetes bacterium]